MLKYGFFFIFILNMFFKDFCFPKLQENAKIATRVTFFLIKKHIFEKYRTNGRT